MRKSLICGNWKMHKNISETIALIRELRARLNEHASIDVAIAPSFVSLAAARQALAGSHIQLASQNCHFEKQGAFTGEISPLMLVDAGCTFALVGHSERRQFAAETDQTVNKRAKAALDAHICPIICIGETLQEREASQTMAVLKKQLVGALAGFSSAEVSVSVIAYEPVWAIGTGKTASSAQVQEVHAAIRQWLTELTNKQTADAVRVLYGGSVKPENAVELLSLPDVDGALVGGASLKSDDFAKIIAGAKKK